MLGSKLWMACLVMCCSIANSLLQLEMMRVPVSGIFSDKNKVECITTEVDSKITKKENEERDSDEEDEDIDEDENYKQICYEKDISYSVPFYQNNDIKYMSMDLTTPISWMKGEDCLVEGSSQSCMSLSSNLKDVLEGISHKISKHLVRRHKKKQKWAQIQGSSQLLKGQLEKLKNIKFYTRETGRFSKFVQTVMLGFWMKAEKDLLELNKTTFIKAREISENLNTLCDGAISLRFDETSEKSFLQEIFNYIKSSEKVITIYIGHQKVLTIGEMNAKNSEVGYGGINWISISDDDNYGKLPMITDVIVDNEQEENYEEENELEIPAVLSLSASYIGLPLKIMNELKKAFQEVRQCSINQVSRYLECKKMKKNDLDKSLTFVFDNVRITFRLSDLILEQHHKSVVFNIKQTLSENFVILGEPLFQNYFIALDYNKNKVGVGPARVTPQKVGYDWVKIVRYAGFAILIVAFICFCYGSSQGTLKKIKEKGKNIVEKGQQLADIRKSKKYSPIQQNPYSQFGTKLQEHISDGDEVEGI